MKDTKTGITVKNKTKIRQNMIPCTNGRLGLTNKSSDYLGLRTNYLCPEEVNFKIYGSEASENFGFI